MSNSIKPKPRFLRTFKLEEDDNGDLLLTFTPEELKILGVKEGDLVDFKIVNGQIHIKKVPKSKESKADPKMSSRLFMTPAKKAVKKPKAKGKKNGK